MNERPTNTAAKPREIGYAVLFLTIILICLFGVVVEVARGIAWIRWAFT